MLRLFFPLFAALVLAPALVQAQLQSAGSQVIAQGTPGVIGNEEEGDFFGNAVATGDFNNDGFDDLAVGVARESVDDEDRAGAVNVLYGSEDGVSTAGDQIWTQDSADVDGEAEAGDEFGFSLDSCDFNGDNFDDLAVGIPGENDGEGAVQIFYGSPAGLEGANTQVWSQASPGVKGLEEGGDAFGFSLACADFDMDGYGDLAVGVPIESVGEEAAAGSVNVLYGTFDGLSAARDELFNQDSEDVAGTAEAMDAFGFSLAAGDFDNDGYPDLAVGVPREGFEGATGAGAVHVIYSGMDGLNALGSQLFTQNSGEIPDSVEMNDEFGQSLAAGDFNNDGFDDLAVGVPGEDDGELNSTGAFNLLFGAGGGLTTADSEIWDQGQPRVLGDPEEFDRFATSLAAGDFDNDGFDDLAVGVPGETVASEKGAGGVQVFYGRAFGFTIASQIWSQESPGIDGEAQAADRMGSAVATGDFNRDGFSDLVAAAPAENGGSTQDTGQVHVIFGGPASSESGELSRQLRSLRGAAARREALVDLLP